MKHKGMLALSVFMALAAALIIYAAGRDESLKFATGGDQGTYYGYGGVLAGKISETTDTNIIAITSGGSQANVEYLTAGDAEFAFIQTDVCAYAYDGTRLFEGKPYTGFSTVANLYLEQVQIVTLDPSIQTVADLKGKVVSVGAPGSGVYFNAVDVLHAYGLDIETDITPTYQSFGDSTEALQDGKIDAAFLTAGAPTMAVTSLNTTRPVYLVGLDEEHVDTLLHTSPYYSKSVIPRVVYDTPEDVLTIAVGAVVVAENTVPEQDVYNFLEGIFANEGEIAAAHSKGLELDLPFAASYGAVPYHKGAQKFYDDHDIAVAGE